MLAAALASALAAFALYRATLLPGLDFGDTGSFQTMVGEALIRPRDGYPLYFAIGGLLLRLTGAEPAHALNLASALEAAAACGLFVVVAAELAGSIAAAVAAAALFAASYTFWSQAIIAEVYALHILFILLSLLCLLRWSRAPSLFRLGLFFACYALGFGNHLSMILLAPGYLVFLLARAPGGWRGIVRLRVIVLAVGLAGVGALPYLWNLRTLWLLPQPPPTLWEGIRTFWFDVTKSDWREMMVWQVPHSMLADHLAMYWADLRQQFGVIGPLLGILGLSGLAVADSTRALLVLLLYGVNVLFAFTYNVGDAHVFYLPSHLVVALLAAVAVQTAARQMTRAAPALALLLAAYASARAYRDFPALDRSHDRRAVDVLDRLTAGLDDQHAIMLADLNWQIANGLSYYTKVTRREVAVAPLSDVLLYAPALVADNRALARDVVLTERARAVLDAAYGPLLPTASDGRVPVMSLSKAVASLPHGTRYVLCVLKPLGDLRLDGDDLTLALRSLGAGRPIQVPEGDYAAVAGLVGGPATLRIGSRLPFRQRVDLRGVPVEVRMESWLAADTIRRMGFGHVIAARRHTLIVERGLSFVAFDDRGSAICTAYAASLFAPQARYLVTPRP